MRTVNYQRDKAVEYAREYALNYNENDYSFASGGGDCMNFVSQCIHAGGMPMKKNGFQWHGSKTASSASWRGVDSFLVLLKNYQKFGSQRLMVACHKTPENLEKGDIVFTVASGNPGDMNRNPSHIVILSQDYKDEQKLVVCGHTTDQRDEEKTRNDRTCTYIHIISICYDFEDADYADSEDRETAKLDWGGSILSTNSATSTYVRNLQTRLNYLGYNAGSVDGRFGTNTKNAVMALQQNAGAYFNLAVDGKVGDQTKEALTFPKARLV